MTINHATLEEQVYSLKFNAAEYLRLFFESRFLCEGEFFKVTYDRGYFKVESNKKGIVTLNPDENQAILYALKILSFGYEIESLVVLLEYKTPPLIEEKYNN